MWVKSIALYISLIYFFGQAGCQKTQPRNAPLFWGFVADKSHRAQKAHRDPTKSCFSRPHLEGLCEHVWPKISEPNYQVSTLFNRFRLSFMWTVQIWTHGEGHWRVRDWTDYVFCFILTVTCFMKCILKLRQPLLLFWLFSGFFISKTDAKAQPVPNRKCIKRWVYIGKVPS